jgi:hypothetical protein
VYLSIRSLKQKEGNKKDNRYYQDTTALGPKSIRYCQDTMDLRIQVPTSSLNSMSGKLSNNKEEQEYLPAIGYRYIHLKEDQDKLSRCPGLPESERHK